MLQKIVQRWKRTKHPAIFLVYDATQRICCCNNWSSIVKATGATDLKDDAMKFAKAAEKFGKILGNDVVTQGNAFSYKQIYQDVVDKAGY